MINPKFIPLKNPPSWRRISVATWRPPNDPTVYGSLKINFVNGKKYLERINEKSSQKITVTHFVAKAVALTLRKYPDINALIRWRRIYVRQSVDIFLQVAIEAEHPEAKPDLSGVKIGNCDQKSLEEIAFELTARALGVRRKEDPQLRSTYSLLKFVPDFFLGWVVRLMGFLIHNLGIVSPRLGLPADPFGSAMVTSVGMFRVPPGFAPLVPLSRVGIIICIGEVKDQPWVVAGKVEAHPILDLKFTFDHRLMDGLTGARMAHYLKSLLEDPELHSELFTKPSDSSTPDGGG